MAGGRGLIGLALPQAKEEYDKPTMQLLLEYIRRLEQASYLRNTHLEIYSPPDSGGRQPLLILRSPNGTRFSVHVDDAGNLYTQSAGTQGQSR